VSLSRRTKLRLALLLAVPFLAIVLLAHFLAPRVRDWKLRSDLAALGDSFSRIDVGDVQVYHDAGVPVEVARALGETLASFSRRLVGEYGEPFLLRPVPAPMVLELFASNRQLAQFHQRRFGEEFHNLGGFYEPRSRVVALPVEKLESALRTTLHEGTHLVFDLASSGGLGSYPIWLNEGIATFFEASRVDPSGEVRLGGRDPVAFARVAAAIDRGEISLDRLLASGPAEFRGPQNGLLYAAAHTFVAFLLLGEEGRYAPRFARYFRELRGGVRSSPRLIYFHLDETESDLEEGWRRFIRRSSRERS